jgi:hypothetical protein
MPFAKGKSGNPGGRPKVVGEVQGLAREYTSRAVETLRGHHGEHRCTTRGENLRRHCPIG